MAYSEELADRIRPLLADRGDMTERKMFGGLCFMLNGNMTCGVTGDDLMARVGADHTEAALAEPHTRPMDFTGRPMKNMVFVEPAGIESDEQLAGWVDACAGYALSLPAK
jgi:TfoX/Sxy family transcriptional regulator of competence genes